ncbi:uncharacterized protein LOC143275716 [Babylonia areolata]|uniref:uncharacterized protein LOC143275716 n=1 Tax=Babylonia areolata TaxID=304850 RepID=UPI003FD36161
MTSLRGYVMCAMTLLASSSLSLTSAQQVVNIRDNGTTTLPSSMVTAPRVGGTSVTEAVVDLISHSCIFDEDNLFLRRLAYLETNDGTAARTYGQSGYYGGIWRVDEAMFKSTQANTPQLRTKYAAIRDVFGIDWMTTQWQDLQKPLYSGLAAALYTFLQGPIPLSVEQQGHYVHERYNTAEDAFSYTRAAKQVPVCDETPHVDLSFLLDATTSADDFLRMRDFVRKVTRSPLEVTGGNVRVSVYQFGGVQANGHPVVQKNIGFTSSGSQQQLQSLIATLGQAKVPLSSPDLSQAVSNVLHDSFPAGSARPLSTKVIVVLTDKAAGSDSGSMLSAAHAAQAEGVTVMTVGFGDQASSPQQEQLMGQLVTSPVCRHRLMVNSSRDLVDLVQLVQRTVCHDPMIAKGMVHCAIKDCRNIAFPLTSPLTTLVANVSCDDGRLEVATRAPRPGRGFQDSAQTVTSSHGATYVTVNDDVAKFLYADLFPMGNTDPGCVATLYVVNGIVGQEKEPTCKNYTYPDTNPCKAPGRKSSRFPYAEDHSMFIQCDLLNNMYLTHCPPDAQYYSAECEMCVGGPNSPSLTGCKGTTVQPTSGPYCGLDHNPCTKENILLEHFYFACPYNESYFIQCNIWGHAFVKRCPPHEVWRQKSLTCEYENTLYNPCGTIPGVRFYPYPPDPHYYVDCGADMVPNILPCLAGLVWNPAIDTCDYPHKPSTHRPPTHLTYPVTFPHTTAQVSYTTPDPSSGLLSKDYAPPCTHGHVHSGRFFWPYPGDKHKYIQCDLWGDAFVRACQASFTFDHVSSTCVDGDVAVDDQLPG